MWPLTSESSVSAECMDIGTMEHVNGQAKPSTSRNVAPTASTTGAVSKDTERFSGGLEKPGSGGKHKSNLKTTFRKDHRRIYPEVNKEYRQS